MKKMLIFCLLIIILMFSHILVQAQGYKGIVPLHSTCEDVERILKIKACSLPEAKYEVPNEEVVFFISTQLCQETVLGRYDVPIGTVLGVVIEFKIHDQTVSPMRLEDFTKDISGFKKSQDDISIFYYSQEKGAEYVVTPDNYIRLIRYSPSKKDKKLLCNVESNRTKQKPYREHRCNR